MQVGLEKYTCKWVLNSPDSEIRKELENNSKLFLKTFENDLTDLKISSQSLASKKLIHILSESTKLKNVDKKIITLLSKTFQQDPEAFHTVYRELNEVASQRIVEKLFEENPTDLFLFEKVCEGSSPLFIEQCFSKGLSKKSIISGYLAFLKNPKINSELIKRFFDEAGRNLNEVKTVGLTELHYACIENPKLIPILVKAGADVNIRTKDDDFPLHLAARNPFITSGQLRALIDAGADISVENAEKELPIESAAKYNPEAVKVFAEAGIDVNYRYGKEKSSVLHRAHLHPELIQFWIEQGADLSLEDIYGHVPLHEACSHFSMTAENLQLLINQAQINAATPLGTTPLLFACKHNMSLLDRLLVNGADVTATDNNGSNALHYAVWNERLKTHDVQKLVDLGLDVHARNKDHFTPLDEAILYNLPILPEILEFYPDLNCSEVLMATKDTYQSQALLQFASLYNLKLLETLASKGANLNMADSNGSFPLHLAVCNKNITVNTIEFLIKNGANPLALDFQGNSILHLACSNPAFSSDDVIRIMELLPKGTENLALKNHKGLSPLHVAARSNLELLNVFSEYRELPLQDESFIDCLLTNPELSLEDIKKFKVDVNVRDSEGLTCIHRAEPRVIPLLIEAGADVHAVDLDGNTLLHFFCIYPYPEIVEALIAKGADVNKKNTTSLTPLLIACLKSPSLVQTLLNSGADVHATDNRKNTPLHLACFNPNVPPEDIKALLEKGADFLVEEEDGFTPLMLALNYNPGAIGPMIEFGYEINATDENGRTELHRACLENPSIIPALLMNGAEVSLADKNGDTPLHLAARNPEITPENLRALIEAGSNIIFSNHKNEIPIEVAVLYNPAALDAFAEIGVGVNYKYFSGETVLHRACEHHPELIEMWISLGADINSLDNDENAPLHTACGNPGIRPELIQPLVNEDLINAKNSSGNTPLLIACRRNVTLLDFLLENGADSKATDNDEMNVLHKAACNDHIKSSDFKKLMDLGLTINSLALNHTPLSIATNPNTILEILALNPDVNVKIDGGSTALISACQNPDMTPAVIKKFIELGADVKQLDDIGITPLHRACEFAPHLIEVLIQAGADVNASDIYGLKPIHTAANASNISAEQIQLLLDQGMSIDDRTSDGRTFLTMVCYKNAPLIKTALKLNAQVNVADDDGFTPLIAACGNPLATPEDIELLFEHGANPQDRFFGTHPLHIACDKNPLLIPVLLEKDPSVKDVFDGSGYLPFHYACENPSISKEHLLMIMGDKVNTPTQDGVMPIQLACRSSSGEAILTLVENGADLTNQVDDEGVSLLNDMCANKNLSPEYFIPLITQGIRFENLGHPDFKIDVLVKNLLDDPKSIHQAMKNGLDIRTLNQVLNTSDLINDPNAYFNYIREPILGCFLQPTQLGLDQAESESEMLTLLKEKASEIFTPPRSFNLSILTVPLLLQSPELREIFKAEIGRNSDFTADFQKMEDFVFDQTYSPKDIFNSLFAVDPSHLGKGVPDFESIPTAPYFDLSHLENMFSEINFTNPDEPGYKNPENLTVFGAPTSVHTLKGGMHTLVTRLQGNEKEKEVGVPESAEEKEIYDENYKNIIMHLGLLLPTMEPSEQATILIDMAAMGLLCGGQFFEAKRLYELYFPPKETAEQHLLPTLEKHVCQNLLTLRSGILDTWTFKLPGQSVHISNRLMLLLGEPLQLPGSAMSFNDPYSGIYLNREELLAKFYHEYTAAAILESTTHYLLESLRDPKKRDEVFNWFQDNVPADYKKEYYDKLQERIHELERKGATRKSIRDHLLNEFDEYLPPDQSIEDAIRFQQEKTFANEYKEVKPSEWKSEFYDPLFATLKEMRDDHKPLKDIVRHLKEHGIRPKIFKMDRQKLEAYLTEKEISIEELPEFLLDKHRTKKYLDYQDELAKEKEAKKSYFDGLIKEVEGLPREAAKKILREKGIEIEDRQLSYLLVGAREMDYRENMITYGDNGYSIKEEAVVFMLQRMNVLVKQSSTD
ncbi:MAG: hypothetical protein CK425_04900, partial [Parachlamydia sp.]